jgi:mono/diheme cytochrome c family protein
VHGRQAFPVGAERHDAVGRLTVREGRDLPVFAERLYVDFLDQLRGFNRAEVREEGWGVDAFWRRWIPADALAVGLLAVGMLGTTLAFTRDQVAAGARTYKRQCARCHGVDGAGKDDQYQGLRAPELIGTSALPCRPRPFQKIRKDNFRTPKDIYDYVSATMPADQPAILDAEEYWDVIAYLLNANGRETDDTPLVAGTAAQIVLHPDCPPGGSS